ncbi:MAG: DUF192 domain-containing protein [Candidatus Doudnabacteria bacterium]|nr:DUF192 domain-containing protein [Candidatus Doudnabacteria bacterium]
MKIKLFAISTHKGSPSLRSGLRLTHAHNDVGLPAKALATAGRDDTFNNNRLLKLLALIFFTAVLAAGCNQQILSSAPVSAQPYSYSHRLQIGSQNLNVEIANTPAEQQQGLSDRISMATGQGMLFDFGSAQMTGFWMKDMKFNLDFIWIADGKVTGVTPDVPAPAICNLSVESCNSRLPVYYPPSPVNWVVEVNAGWAKKNNITAGDEAVLKK